MTGRMEDGEEGAPSEEKLPLPNLLARLASPLPSKPFGWWGGGRWEYRWMGMGQGAADFLR